MIYTAPWLNTVLVSACFIYLFIYPPHEEHIYWSYCLPLALISSVCSLTVSSAYKHIYNTGLFLLPLQEMAHILAQKQLRSIILTVSPNLLPSIFSLCFFLLLLHCYIFPNLFF